ncbi:MAG: 5-methyltetrahydropteroyltriglutamate--homocysteine S-methyltransferase [Candidatus Eremiobacteraeota bacterium]|nr:5-methyltetrahydropteroyltriglutamate--homocysteine S-methyltransferase [Candidatus Eremiobacteraeota bacterium]MBC5828509.1 5-methyltetrahydropteroyltriglutamate--homocysteine S-methyltransferase [Candidatus Eremiobacteraeota bacterium]
MSIAHNLGFPRIGRNREIKKALERFWKGEIGPDVLEETGRAVRAENWSLQLAAGMDYVPVGDFSYYDHILDVCALTGAVPVRYGFGGGKVELETYFAMARGTATAQAMEMTKWFDTNYHYIVPELGSDTRFALSGSALFEQAKEAQALGARPKPVIVGPLTFLWLGKERGAHNDGFSRLDLLDRLVPVYEEILHRFAAMGIEWAQLDEPALAVGLDEQWLRGLSTAYERLALAGPKILLGTYFDSVAECASQICALPVGGVHLDLIRAPHQLEAFLQGEPGAKVLSLGVVDGRNVWRTDLSSELTLLERAKSKLGSDLLWIAPSCSLLHSPIDLSAEDSLAADIKSWMAFAVQKLHEVFILKTALDGGRDKAAAALSASDKARQSRLASPRTKKAALRDRLAVLTADDARRRSPYSARQEAQRRILELPAFPTTTIGSFPQTSAIREARLKLRRGQLDERAYEQTIKSEIEHAVREQERLGLDVLVHGEAERNDMVEYFGEQLDGFAFTKNGWVQSYGSRYVKPPIIFGDVSRPGPMTVSWSSYAQSLTSRPMKGMLTGPVTILQWSFVRDDQPRSDTALQIALAIRDEVIDLEHAGIKLIQIDEPAMREGLPLKRRDWGAYLAWAVRAFRVASSGVADVTQIHTHMCYSEFNDILPSIADMDADVITIECSRSQMELLDAFGQYRYPNEIGPGVYDIHSPRIPSTEEMLALLRKASGVVPSDQLWVNPDCGLKTRRWEEVVAALENMVAAARSMRKHDPTNVTPAHGAPRL